MRKPHRLLCAALLLVSSVAAAQFDPASLVGEHWYGLYMSGQKVGYSMEKFELADDGTVHMIQDAAFKLNMAGIRQDMRIFSRRVYDPTGPLLRFESTVEDMSGTQRFRGEIEGDVLTVHSEVGGRSTTREYPAPDESLDDALQVEQLIGEGAEIGATVETSLFEPMYEREIVAVSTLIAKEERLFDGVPTEVFRIQTKMAAMGVQTESWVLADGTRLEDRVAGLIVMRLEPKEVAQDVDYVNDTVVSNAAMVEKAIPKARTRESLKLILDGPLTDDHVFNDAGQRIEPTDEGRFAFVRELVSIDAESAPPLPITVQPHAEFTEPTLYVQSDHPRLQQTARQIIGDETNAWRVTELLTEWVYDNVRPTYSARLSNSLDVLETLEGDCTEHSMLFIGLARAVGLPAKEVAGLIYSDLPKPGFYFHQWASVWVGEWVDVDPTFNQPIADTTHVKLSEGDISRQIQLLPIIGQLQVEVVD